MNSSVTREEDGEVNGSEGHNLLSGMFRAPAGKTCFAHHMSDRYWVESQQGQILQVKNVLHMMLLIILPKHVGDPKHVHVLPMRESILPSL